MRCFLLTPIQYFMKHVQLTILLAGMLCLTAAGQTSVKPSFLPVAALPGDSIAETAPSPAPVSTAIVFPELLQGNEENMAEYLEKFSVNRREYLLRIYQREQRYSQQIIPLLQRYDIPVELRVLVALESAYNPYARSRAGAYGYWQFMDGTAKEYGLAIREVKTETIRKKNGRKVTVKKLVGKRDDRSSLYRSTLAAARYLRDRRKNLNNDWLLIVASYNYGIGNVWDVMQRSGLENPTFWDIKDMLPSETRNYVLNFIALNVIFHNYENYLNNPLAFVNKPATDVVADAAMPAAEVTITTDEDKNQ